MRLLLPPAGGAVPCRSSALSREFQNTSGRSSKAANTRADTAVRSPGPLLFSLQVFRHNTTSDSSSCSQFSAQHASRRTASYLHQIAPLFERSDVYAQLLRLRLYGESLGALPLDAVAAADEARHAIGFQLSTEDPRVSGGFSFGRKFGKFLPFVNPASSAFCAQALTLWADHKNNAMNADLQSLI